MGLPKVVLIHVGKFVIPCDFIIVDIDENFQAPSIFRRPFLATRWVVIIVLPSIISFQLYGERDTFCFPSHTTPYVSITIYVLDAINENRYPIGGFSQYWSHPIPLLASSRGLYVCIGEVADSLQLSYVLSTPHSNQVLPKVTVN